MSIITRNEVIEKLQKLGESKPPKNLCKKVLNPKGEIVRHGTSLPKPVRETASGKELSLLPKWDIRVEVPCPECKRGKFSLRLNAEDFDGRNSDKHFSAKFYERFSDVPHRVELKYDPKLIEKLEDFFAKEVEQDVPAYAALLPERNEYVSALGPAIEAFREAVEKVRKQGLDAKLLVSDYCPRCGGGFDEEAFRLEIVYPDRLEPVRIRIAECSTRHLEIMAVFLQGKDRYVTVPTGYIDALSSGGACKERALNDVLFELKHLFGVA